MSALLSAFEWNTISQRWEAGADIYCRVCKCRWCWKLVRERDRWRQRGDWYIYYGTRQSCGVWEQKIQWARGMRQINWDLVRLLWAEWSHGKLQFTNFILAGHAGFPVRLGPFCIMTVKPHIWHWFVTFSSSRLMCCHRTGPSIWHDSGCLAILCWQQGRTGQRGAGGCWSVVLLCNWMKPH